MTGDSAQSTQMHKRHDSVTGALHNGRSAGDRSMPEAPFVTAAAIRATLEAQGFTRLVGAEVVSVEPGVVVMAVNRRPELLQQAGLFHGGVIAYLIDNATTAAAATVIDRATRTVITAEYKINLVSPSLGDRLSCRAEVVKPGRLLTVVEAKVFCRTKGEEKLVAVALATIANLDVKTPGAGQTSAARMPIG
jgi:uncharacterized protein (TIGR00369 family)